MSAHFNRPNLISDHASTVLCFAGTRREEAMKKLTVLCTALTASVLCGTPNLAALVAEY
jgi:hypothetical protein